MRSIVAVLLCLSLAPAFSAEHLPASDAEFDSLFLCPESLLDENAREKSVEAFVAWVVEHHPDWTLEQLAEFRLRLLVSHHCDATLAAIRAAAPEAK